jgi:hypothetical protein
VFIVLDKTIIGLFSLFSVHYLDKGIYTTFRNLSVMKQKGNFPIRYSLLVKGSLNRQAPEHNDDNDNDVGLCDAECQTFLRDVVPEMK